MSAFQLFDPLFQVHGFENFAATRPNKSHLWHYTKSKIKTLDNPGQSDILRPLCATNTPTPREVWNCVKDEGWPLGVGDQESAPNHRELLSLRAMVVSVAETAGLDPVR